MHNFSLSLCFYRSIKVISIRPLHESLHLLSLVSVFWEVNVCHNFSIVCTFNILWVPILIQFSSVAQSCPTLCDPINHSTPGLPVHHQLPEPTQTDAHWVDEAIQPSHPLSSLSPPAPNASQHQGLFQWVNSSHEVAKVLEFQLQHQFFQWIFETDLF